MNLLNFLVLYLCFICFNFVIILVKEKDTKLEINEKASSTVNHEETSRGKHNIAKHIQISFIYNTYI